MNKPMEKLMGKTVEKKVNNNLKVKKLTPAMRQAIEIYVNNPGLTYGQLAEEVQRSVPTIQNWFHNQLFLDSLNARFDEKWADAASLAQQRMIHLITDDNKEVSFKASQYVLNCHGYKPSDKVEVSSNDINITINKDKEEEVEND